MHNGLIANTLVLMRFKEHLGQNLQISKTEISISCTSYGNIFKIGHVFWK